jgi:hypothetical protein
MATPRASAPAQSDLLAWLDETPTPSKDKRADEIARDFDRWLDEDPRNKPKVAKPQPAPKAKRVEQRQVSIVDELRDSPGKVFKLAADTSIPGIADLIAQWTGTGPHATPGRVLGSILFQVSCSAQGGLQVALTQPGARHENRVTYHVPLGPPSGIPISLSNPDVLAWLDRLLADVRETPITAHSPLLILCESETYTPGALRDREQVRDLKQRLTELAAQHTATVAVIKHFPGLSPALQLIPLDADPMPS